MEMFFFGIYMFNFMMAIIIAMAAKKKGRSGIAWFFYGSALMPIALIHVIRLKSLEDHYIDYMADQGMN